MSDASTFPADSGTCLLEVTAATPEVLVHARELFAEYQEQLGIDLEFQGFASEVAQLPGDYTAPLGTLLVAYVDGQAAGCCAMRARPDADHINAAEMKRLYVRPAFRRFGLGRLLAEHVLGLARHAGYGCLLLDTLDDMEAARNLYQELGFEEIAPYYHNPVAGAHYLKASL